MLKDGRHIKHEGYAPYALFLVTRYPYHNSFLRILNNFISITNPSIFTGPQFIDDLYCMLALKFQKYSTSLLTPNPNITPIAVDNHNADNVGQEIILISCPNKDEIIFECSQYYTPLLPNDNGRFSYVPSLHPDINWSVLFRVLEPMHILTVMTALLTEQKVVLVSNHASLFFMVCEALLSLIYPFQWIHFCRPFITPCHPFINHYLTHDQPALFGLLSCSITALPIAFKVILHFIH